MRMLSRKRGIAFFSIFSVIVMALVIFGGHIKEASAKKPSLSNSQCVVCHPDEPATIKAHGGKHKTKVGCQDCHVEHPPAGTNAIPACSMCHSDKVHYDLKNCSACHSNTHAPVDLKLEGEITGPCLTCHQQQGDEVKNYPSAHTDLACSECHTTHRQIPDCMECHEKHTEDMELKTCLTCHPVHMPLQVTYTNKTPSRYCGSCHKKAAGLLQANTSKHHDLACAYCHRSKHKVIPPCTACHGQPHPYSMLQKFPECGNCHSSAHDLR